jgi:hypothetical protein
MADLHHLPSFSWTGTDLADSFQLFQQRMDIFFKLKGVKDEHKVSYILLATGDEGMRRFNSWNLTNDERKQPNTVFNAFLEQLEPADSFRVCRLTLSQYKQQPGESIDVFINRCRLLARKCKLSEADLNDRILELLIASTPFEDFQKDLLSKDDKFTLGEAIQLGRTYEATAAHAQRLHNLNNTDENGATAAVAAIRKGKDSNKKPHRHAKNHAETEKRKESLCKCCGCSHRFGKEHCPARNSTCDKCKRKGHWGTVCLAKENARSKSSKARKVDSLVDETHDLEHQLQVFNFDSLDAPGPHTEAYTILQISLQNTPGIHNFKVKVDTGAQANTMPYRTFAKMFPEHVDKAGTPLPGVLERTNQILSAYNNTTIPCAGTLDLNCKAENSTWQIVQFHVVDVAGPAILGLASCIHMKVVSLHCAIEHNKKTISSVQDLVKYYPEMFDKIGKFPTVQNLQLDPSVPSHIDAPRRTPIALQDKIKQELDNMVAQDVIRKIEEPTEWVSSLTYVTKGDGSLRVCLDPRHLNKALIRPVHKMKTLEELNYQFRNAKVFSKLDAKAGYWAVPLNEASQKLTTFQTPFGRFCFKRLPFGLSVSQDLFQMEMDRILEQCEGVCGIADDIVIYGKDDKEHDQNLIAFMETAKKHGLTLNSKKCTIKQTQVSFFGNVYTANGIHPDPKKIQDLLDMPEPSNKTELQSFMGFMTYLSSYVHNFSTKTAVLRDLLKKDSAYIWEAHHKKSFDSLKEEVSTNSVLRYYDPSKPVYVHCDASLRGLGAALLQPDSENELRPVTFASKSLTDVEQRYACIERELLAIVFAVKRFHTYLYGRTFNVITDHKPLVMICDKSLTAAPARLQRMMIQLQGYNFKIQYLKGTENQIADGLSRLPTNTSRNTINLDIRVDPIRFADHKVEQLRQQTAGDITFNQLKDTIIQGWPDTIQEVPTAVRTYWSVRDQLSVNNGIIMKGQQVVIPPSMQGDILAKIHTPHLGIEKSKLLAKDTVYWPSVNKDIEQLVQSCKQCQAQKPSQQAEPLHPHELPARAWANIAADLFEHDNKQYLLIVDYYSKFPIVRKLPTPAPSTVIIDTLKLLFSEMGIPDKLVSDNGPHFISEKFKDFASTWNFAHITSSPRRAQGNGLVERNVQTAKNILTKATEAGTDPYLALLYWRTVPISNKLPSPAELLMQRRMQSTLPSNIANSLPDQDVVRHELETRQQQQKACFDKHARTTDLPKLTPGQQVRVEQPSGRWDPATVVSTHSYRSYLVRDKNGTTIRRNRQNIREVPPAPSHTQTARPASPVREPPPTQSNTPRAHPTTPAQNRTTNGNNPRGRTTRCGRATKPPERLDL